MISGNGQQGVWLSGTNGNVVGNVIQGNFIGLNAAGTGRLGNANVGIGISGAANNLIGGTTAGARNVISANGNSATFGGVFLAYAAQPAINCWEIILAPMCPAPWPWAT